MTLPLVIQFGFYITVSTYRLVALSRKGTARKLLATGACLFSEVKKRRDFAAVRKFAYGIFAGFLANLKLSPAMRAV